VNCKLLVLLAFSAAAAGYCQTPIAYVPLDGAKVSGALDVANGKAAIGASGTITAGDRAVQISLPNRGELQLCSTSTLHLATDSSVATSQAGLLLALDRGALEARFSTGKFSDVLMTPDFRILLSGPGAADLRVRVNTKGDTCVDNHGENAPYVTVSSLFEGGAYRVQPNQRVLFEHGSLHEVVDKEPEACGCPAAAAAPKDSSSFPVAVSEGLAAPPVPTAPVAQPGETHTQVTAKLSYDGQTGKTNSVDAPEPSAASTAPATDASATAPAVASPVPPTPAPAKKEGSGGGFFHRIGHFFGHLFG
jgi:hypothetical protein